MSGQEQSLAARLEKIRDLEAINSRRRKVPIHLIADALIKGGYTSLDEQAKALGIHRATTWTIMRNKHKLGYLNAKTTERMLANPELPQCIRDVLQRYVAERPWRSKRITQATDNAAEDK